MYLSLLLSLDGDVCVILLLIIIGMNVVGVKLMQDCPLSLLEKKYLPISCVSFGGRCIQYVLSFKDKKASSCSCTCSYNRTRKYEKILEYLVNVWIIAALKCMFLMILRICRPFQLENTGNLYA